MKKLNWEQPFEFENHFECKIGGKLKYAVSMDVLQIFFNDKETFMPPKQYRCVSNDEAKQVAEDLENNINIKLHEKKHLKQLEEDNKFIDLINETKALLEHYAKD